MSANKESVLDLMREALATLTRTERRIAESILDRPHAAISWSITDLARFANTSDPSVIRFCRKMGCSGFPALKLELAQALARVQISPRPPIEGRGDATVRLIDDVLGRSQQALQEARADLQPDSVRQAAVAIARARRIDIYGFGVSGFVAQEVQHRLASLGLSATAYSDPVIQATTAPLLDAGAVVIALSFSGLTRYLRENVEMAKKGGSKIISIAPSGSPVANLADINLALNAYRRSENFLVAPTARISFHMLIDILATAVVAELQRPPARHNRPKRKRPSTRS